MTDESIKQTFLEAAQAWVCDGYSLDVRFLAGSDGEGYRIWDASIALNPLPVPRDDSFRIDSAKFVVGQIQRHHESKKSLLALVARAASGVIQLPDKELILPPSDRAFNFYSEMSHRDRWFSKLHLQVGGGVGPPLSPVELTEIDNTLRTSSPPFDGLTDAAAWLGLRAPGINSDLAAVNVRVGPPVDLISDECMLADDRLNVTLHVHPAFDIDHVGLAVRAGPGDGAQLSKTSRQRDQVGCRSRR